MRFKTIILAFTLYVTSATKGHSLSRLHLSNASDTYKVQENKATNTIQFTNPRTNTPTLREIIYYHIIEKPFFGSNENDQKGSEFEDSTRPFTNAHSMPENIPSEDTNKNIIDKESSEEGLATSSNEKLDDMDNIEDGKDKNDQSVSEINVVNEPEEGGEPLIGVEVILNEEQSFVDENMNRADETAILEDDKIKENDKTDTQEGEIYELEGETGLTEIELILNEDSEVETATAATQEPLIEKITEHFDIMEQDTPKIEESRTLSEKLDTNVKEMIETGDIAKDAIETVELTTPKTKTEYNKENGTTKREIGGTKVNAIEKGPNVNYTRNTEILMTKRSRLFGSPEHLKERALKMKNIMPSVKIRQPEEKRRRKRDVTDDIPEGPTLPELDYSTLPEYVRSIIPSTEKPVPSTKSIENPKHIEESKDAILSSDMEDRLKNILNQIKPLLTKSVSDVNDEGNEKNGNENDKEIEKSDDVKMKNMFKGRTYGMNLNSGRGSAWNDIINDNGNHVHFGDSIPDDAQEHLNFYHDEAYSDEDDIRREIIKRIQEIFANTEKNKGNGNEDSNQEGRKDYGQVNTGPKAIQEKAEETSDNVNEKFVEKEEVAEKDDKLNHSPDKHKETERKLVNDTDGMIIFEDENSSSDNQNSDSNKENDKNVESDNETPIIIPEDASDAEFMKQLRQGRTYGMNLTDDEGVVWNDLFTKPGVRIHVGEDSTDEQLNEDNNSELLEPFDSETTSADHNDADIYVKVDRNKTSKDDTTTAKSHDAKDTNKTKPTDKIDCETNNFKDIEKQNYDDPEISTESSAKSNADLDLASDVLAAVIGLENDKEQSTEAELHTNKNTDDKEKFWKWMTEWTTAYTQILTGFIDEKISDAMSDFKTSLKPADSTEIAENPKDIEMVADKEPDETIKIIDDRVTPVNDTNLLRKRKDKDHKNKDTEVSKVNSTESLPNVAATTIYGNAVGNKKVTNIFVFLTERNASLNFVQDIIKDGDKVIGDEIKPSVEEKGSMNEGISVNTEQSKPEVSKESTENVATESAITQDVEERKDDSNNQEPTEPKTNEVVGETSTHENITSVNNKEVDKSSEMESEGDKLIDTEETEQGISKTDILSESVKEDTAANTEEPKTNIVNDKITNISTLSDDKVKNTEVSKDNKQEEDRTTTAEESAAKTNIVLDERIINDNIKTSEDIQSEKKTEEIATNTDTVTNIDIENPNVNLTDVQVSRLNNENEEVTTLATTDSIESATLA